MKFTLVTSGRYYSEERKAALEKLGFTFEDCRLKEGAIAQPDTPFFRTKELPGIEIDTLEELLEFNRTWGDIILIDGDVLEIYDSWRG